MAIFTGVPAGACAHPAAGIAKAKARDFKAWRRKILMACFLLKSRTEVADSIHAVLHS
jgi:hypothetical protein